MKNIRFLLFFTIFTRVLNFADIYSAALPSCEDSELSKPCPSHCSVGSDWSDFNPSVDTYISFALSDAFDQSLDIRSKISNLQHLRDRGAIKSELIEIINTLTVPDQLNWSGVVSLADEVNRILNVGYLGYDCCTLLHLVILELNDFELVAKLVDMGACVNAIFRANEGVCGALGMCNDSLDLARYVGNHKIIELLREKNVQISRLPTPFATRSSSRSSDGYFMNKENSMPFASVQAVISPDREMLGFDEEALAFQGSDILVQDGLQTTETRVKEVLKFIQNLKEGTSPIFYLKMIIDIIKSRNEFNNPGLREAINKPFSVYNLGYQMCSLLHLVILELKQLEDVEVLVRCGADVNAELRIYPEIAPLTLQHLSACHNALELAFSTKNYEVAEFLTKRGARVSKFFRASLAAKVEPPISKCSCAIC